MEKNNIHTPKAIKRSEEEFGKSAAHVRRYGAIYGAQSGFHLPQKAHYRIQNYEIPYELLIFTRKKTKKKKKKTKQNSLPQKCPSSYLIAPQMRLNRRNSWCNCANQHAWHGARASGSSVHRLSYSSFTSHCARYFCCKF